MCLPSGGVVGPVGILILNLEPYDWSSIRALQGYQNLEESGEVLRHGLGVGSIVGAKYHSWIMQ